MTDRPVRSKRIRHVAYDPSWPDQFESHARKIRSALGELALMIEHIGSTSVPGLIAKPKVDILLVVPDSTNEPSYVPPMEAAGFDFRLREPNWHEHRLLSPSARDANVHVVSEGCSEIDRWLRFRDRLRSDPVDRDLYAVTKQELARRRWRDTDEYAEAKSDVIELILSKVG